MPTNTDTNNGELHVYYIQLVLDVEYMNDLLYNSVPAQNLTDQ